MTRGVWAAIATTTLATAGVMPALATAQETVVFDNVNVVPMDEERVLAGQTVVVHGDRIWSVGPAGTVAVPGDATRIDASGKYLMPGLAEMHGHTPGRAASKEMVETVMFLYVANGVTTVRGMLGSPGQLDLKASTNSGELLGPTLYLAGPSFSGGTVTSPEQAAVRVRLQKEQGWDLLKVHPGLTRDEYDAMARTASALGLRFGGHVPEEVGLEHALRMGQQTFDHLDGYVAYLDAFDRPIDAARLDDIVRRTRAAGAAVVPTMVLWDLGIIGNGETDQLVMLPELRYWPRAPQPGVPVTEQWIRSHRQRADARRLNPERARVWSENRRQILAALNAGGVTILMGTDSPQIFSVPGFSLHREMAAMAGAGMTPYEILRSGTQNVGAYFQAQDTFGTVQVGRRADLILLNSNPLDAIANVADRAGVMVRGRWLSEGAIQTRLEAIAAALGN